MFDTPKIGMSALLLMTFLGGCSETIGLGSSGHASGHVRKMRGDAAGQSPFDYYEYTTDDTKPHDAVIVFFPGSGCTDVGSLLGRIFWPLDGRFLVVAMNKRGVVPDERDPTRCSEIFYRENTLKRIVLDQAAFVRFVWRTHPVRQRILFGQSEGGITLPEVASLAPGATHATLLSSSVASGEAILWADLADRGEEGRREALDTYRTNASPDIRSDAFGHSNQFKAELMNYHPATFVSTISIPILIANGGRDRRLPVSVQREVCTVARHTRSRFSYFFVPEAGHEMKIEGQPSLAPRFFRIFEAWLDGTADAPTRDCPYE